MIDITQPDGIVKWTGSEPASIQAASQAQGDSVQLALDARQMYTYRWANDAARTSQTGMRDGDQGYQVNTGYWWDRISGAWVRRYGTLITDPTGIFTIAANYTLTTFNARVSERLVEFTVIATRTTSNLDLSTGGAFTFGTFAVGWRPLLRTAVVAQSGTTSGAGGQGGAVGYMQTSGTLSISRPGAGVNNIGHYLTAQGSFTR